MLDYKKCKTEDCNNEYTDMSIGCHARYCDECRFKMNKCKVETCNEMAAKDRFGLFGIYCKNCNPRNKFRKCKNEICQNPKPKDKYGNYKQYCCNDCMSESRQAKFDKIYGEKSKDEMDAILQTRRETLMLSHGVDNVSKIPEVREKLRIAYWDTFDDRREKTIETNQRNYGVDSYMETSEFREKTKLRCIADHGAEHYMKVPEIAAKVALKNTENAEERMTMTANTKLKKYGDRTFNNREKLIETCMEKYNVSNPQQVPEFFERQMVAAFKYKEYIFPSGKIANIQGYENYALDELLKSYNEEDIITGRTEIPTISYIDKQGVNHVYFPDIYIPKENLIIEVKSQYTHSGTSEHVRINTLKMNACIAQGYNFKYMIMDPKIIES